MTLLKQAFLAALVAAYLLIVFAVPDGAAVTTDLRMDPPGEYPR